MIPSVVQSTKLGREAFDVFSAEFGNRCIYLFSEINDLTAAETIAQLRQLDRADGEITLLLNSPGGSVTAGWSIIDAMEHTRNPVTVIGTGMVASMAAVILVAGDKRLLTGHSQVMIHQPLGQSMGQATDIQIAAGHIAASKQELIQYLSGKTGQSPERLLQDMERDYFLTASEAIQYGLADEMFMTRRIKTSCI